MGLTVDGSDNLWVTEATGGGTVDKFNSQGAYVAQTASPPWTGVYIESAAFSAAAGEVFVSDSNNDDLWGLKSTAAYAGNQHNLGIGGCCFIRVAADNSAAVADGDLYISTGSSVLRIDGETGAADNFTSSEPYVSGNKLTGPFSSAGGLAVDANGFLYLAAGNQIDIFEPSGDLAGEITEFEGSPLGAITAVAIDPSNESVLVAEAGAIEEFSAGGEPQARITEANGAPLAGIQGLAADSAGTLYAADRAAGVVDVFGSAPNQSETKFPLQVTVSGNGSVSSAPAGISCGSGACSHEFKEGKTVTLSAHPALHNHFVEWSGADVASCASPVALTCIVTMGGSRSFTAEFAPTMRSLTVTPTGPGSVTAATGAISGCEAGGGSCSDEYAEGSVVTLLATPGVHNHVSWGAGECKAEPSANECEVQIAPEPTAVHPAFSINRHTLTVAHTGLGSVSASEGAISSCSAAAGTCSGVYDEATTIVLTATPAAHKHVVWGAGDCRSESGPDGEECEVEIGPTDPVVAVSFQPNKHLLTVTTSGQGSVHATSGTITHCTAGGGSCAGEYIEAATVTLAATPGSGQTVAWGGCTKVPSTDTCEVQIGEADSSVTASFVPGTHTLSVTERGTGQGSVLCNGSACASSYQEGTDLTLTAAAAAGSTFAGWSGAGCSGTGACEVTIEADTAINASFAAVLAHSPLSQEHCVVPPLSGLTLKRARAALGAAHCSVGKVSRPKRGNGGLLVRSSSPSRGAILPDGGDVNLRLGAKKKGASQ